MSPLPPCLRGKTRPPAIPLPTVAIVWQQDCYQVMRLSGEGREAVHRLYEQLVFQVVIEKGFVIQQADGGDTVETPW